MVLKLGLMMRVPGPWDLAVICILEDDNLSALGISSHLFSISLSAVCCFYSANNFPDSNKRGLNFHLSHGVVAHT